MATKKPVFNPLKSGSDPRKEQEDREKSQRMWFKPQAGETVVATILEDADDILNCEQCAIWLDQGNSPVWVFLGPDDPSIELGVDRRYRAYIPLMLGDDEPQIWSVGKGVHGQLLDISDANGGKLKGLVVQIKRTGNGLQTRYSIVPTGKRRKVEGIEKIDVISLLGPLDVDEIKEMIADKLGMVDYDAVVEYYKGQGGVPGNKVKASSFREKKTIAPVRGKHASTTPAIEDDEEDLEDVSLI
jgi:hypothetical protein